MTVRRIETQWGHKYETDQGQPVPGVTTLIGKAIPKPALVNWAANTTAGYCVDHWDDLTKMPISERLERIKKEWRGVRDRAAARGTQVHAYAEALQAGPVDVPPELAPYVEPAARFLDDWQVQPLVIEAVVYSEKPLYAGTLDLIADLAGNRRWLLDWKTSGKGVWPETQMQLTMYRWADSIVIDGKAQEMLDVDRSGAIWLPGDGTYSLLPVNTEPDMWRGVLSMYDMATWVNHGSNAEGRRSLVGQAITPPPRLAVVQGGNDDQ